MGLRKNYEDQRILQWQYDIPTLTLMLIILEFQFTFLMEVCLNPIIYFFMIYANIRSLLSVNSRLIFDTSPHIVCPPGFIFSNHVPISRTSIVAIHKYYFSHIWYLNTNITFGTYLYPQQYHH